MVFTKAIISTIMDDNVRVFVPKYGVNTVLQRTCPAAFAEMDHDNTLNFVKCSDNEVKAVWDKGDVTLSVMDTVNVIVSGAQNASEWAYRVPDIKCFLSCRGETDVSPSKADIKKYQAQELPGFGENHSNDSTIFVNISNLQKTIESYPLLPLTKSTTSTVREYSSCKPSQKLGNLRYVYGKLSRPMTSKTSADSKRQDKEACDYSADSMCNTSRQNRLNTMKAKRRIISNLKSI
eukprot:TRINITY_DN1039_c0_g2_i3.p1 TRINITY_DN1039_c0_g2~~TRINITY_DN1039_c0_g2_i3.p1  ORF type:complete len:235 (-),score=41.99 TRINITY_DN1039_c0_g2_i3:147-851(-)